MSVLKAKVGGAFVTIGGGGGGELLLPPLNPTVYPLDPTYGDEMDAVPLGGAWTKRNIAQAETLVASAPWKGAGVSVVFDAQGDALTRPMPAGDFEIVAALSYSGDLQAMAGLCMLDASGNGGAYGLYNDGRIYSWNVSNYNYVSTGTANGGNPGPGVFFLSMRKVGTNATCRHSGNGIDWSGTVSVSVGAAQMGLLRPYVGGSLTITIYRFNVYYGPGFYS